MSNTGPQKRDVEQAVEEENATLRATRSAGAFTISPELFEKVRDLLSTYWSTIDGSPAVSRSQIKQPWRPPKAIRQSYPVRIPGVRDVAG